MKKYLLLLVFLCSVVLDTQAQSITSDYVVSTNTSASLVSMTGSERLVGPNANNTTSYAENLSFDFWFMGVRYTNFTVNSNGLIRFGTSGISNTQTGNGFPLNGGSRVVLAPFAGDLKTTATTGKIHSIVTGAAPNRKCIIEFLNMGLGATSTTANGTFQVILNETTGIIQYIYGAMNIANITGVSGTESVVIGFSSDSVNLKTLSLNHSTFAVNTNIPATKNSYGTGVIASLNSAANGSRREIRFTPPVLNAPTLPTVTAPTTNSLTVNWVGTAVSNEEGFVIYKSDDGGDTYDFAFQTGANATTAVITNLLGGTNYMFKIHSVSEGALSAPITASGTTTGCGASVTNTLNLTGSGPFTWSALAASWSTGQLPTSCNDAIINYNGTTATNEQITFNFDVDIAVKSLTINNISTSTSQKVFNMSGYGRVTIAGDLVLTCPGGNKFNRCAYSTQNKTTVNGNLILNRAAGLHTVTEGQSAIGSNGNAREQLYLLRGDMTFNKRGYTTDEHANFTFDKAGTQYLYNYTTPQPFPYVQGIGDTLQAVLFEKLVVGSTNATTLIFAGTGFDGYMESVSREGVTIGVNSTLDFPQNYSINSLGGSSYFRMLSGSKLRLGGDQTISPNGTIYGVPGSNFPASFSPYTFDPTSTIEYYGSNGITQTIYNGVTYQNLVASNGNGSGRAQKITTAPVTINTSFNINALADVTLGLSGSTTQTVSSAGPLNVNANGGLYCNANVVSGAGAFTMGNGSFLGMGHAQGISLLGNATGNIQMTGGRIYNSTGNYIYNGIVNQVTGNGLPTTINELTIDNANTVTNSQNVTVNSLGLLKQGVFDILSTTFTSNGANGMLNSTGGKMKANQGIVEMKGSSGAAQNISGSWFVNKNISTLINANTTGITVAATPADTLLISSALLYGAVTNSAINTNDNLTFLSRDTATARFGTMVSGNSITGKVTIERYLPAKKSWRLLAAPVANATAPTVTNSWRESGAPLTSNGYGTRITGPASFVGVDEYTQRASMKYYNGTLNNYVDVSNTNTNISNTAGYYVFVRGDRGVPVSGAAAPTILRIKGNVNSGGQVVNIPAGKFVTFGNPYASRIDFRTLVKSGITTSFIVWNPNAAGNHNVGAFETYTLNAGDYKKVPGGTIRNFIESGEAVFIQSNGGAGTLNIAETDKAGGTSTPVSRMSNAVSRIGGTSPTLEVNMYTKDTDGSSYLADGILMNFDNGYSSAVDNDDVRKISNTGDNLFLKNGAANLVVESRPLLKEADTIKLNLTNTRVNPYRFEIAPSVLESNGLEASLLDKFLASETPVNLSRITSYNFDITADAASRAADRFMIVFKRVSPMRFVKINAARNKNNTATVNWYTENENNINTYTIEHSKDGIHFTEVGRQTPTANNNGNPYYSFVHTAAVDGYNWYRIKANAITGTAKYSNVAKIGAKEIVLPTAITIFPNPVTEGKVHVSFVNETVGKYQLTINNMAGQTIHSETLQLQSNNLQKTIGLGNAARGNYQLIVKDEAGNTKRIPFIVK